MNDDELIKRLADIFSRYSQDQNQPVPLHDHSRVHLEVDGELADLLFQDKAENQVLIRFLSIYLNIRKRGKEEVQAHLEDLARAFDQLSKG